MNPTPEEIKNLRLEAGLSRKEVAELMHVSLRTVENWERKNEKNARKMHPAFWELYLIKIKTIIKGNYTASEYKKIARDYFTLPDGD